MKFIADRMLGRLVKWMRIAGLDVYYDKNIDRSSLIRIGREQKRTILTRARDFHELKNIPPFYYLKEEILEDQLRNIFSQYKNLIDENNFYTRCIECNRILDEISKADVKERVPPKSFNQYYKYMICPHCRKVYWKGTHVD